MFTESRGKRGKGKKCSAKKVSPREIDEDECENLKKKKDQVSSRGKHGKGAAGVAGWRLARFDSEVESSVKRVAKEHQQQKQRRPIQNVSEPERKRVNFKIHIYFGASVSGL